MEIIVKSKIYYASNLNELNASNLIFISIKKKFENLIRN